MHDPRLSYIYMRKDSLLQCMHEAAAKHGTRSISSNSFQWQTKLGFNFVESLWYGRSWPQSQSERGKSNLEWKKNTFILSNYNELVDFLSSGMETPWLAAAEKIPAMSHRWTGCVSRCSSSSARPVTRLALRVRWPPGSFKLDIGPDSESDSE